MMMMMGNLRTESNENVSTLNLNAQLTEKFASERFPISEVEATQRRVGE